MNTTQRTLIQSRSAKWFAAMAALTLCCVSTVQANERNISFGEPGKNGTVKINITLTKNGTSGLQCYRYWNAAIADSDTANGKATKVYNALPASHSFQCDSGNHDVSFTLVGNVVRAISTPTENWRISGFYIEPDNSKETEAYNAYSTRDRGLVSLAGTADGSGSVTVQVGKGTALVTATVMTSNGQTASAIEDAILTQLIAGGVSARLSTPDDRLDLVHAQGDGRAIVILKVDDIVASVVSQT